MTRYVMEIDLGECEDREAAGKEASRVMCGQIAFSGRIREAPSLLPVLRTCGECRDCIRIGQEDACDRAPRLTAPPYTQRTDRFAAPPSWCPKREEAP